MTVTNGVAGSSGTFTNTVAVTSGITAQNITLTSGINASTGQFSSDVSLQRGFYRFVETATSSWASIVSYGVSVIKSTETAQHMYALGAPVVGLEKTIICNSVTVATGSSTGAAIVTSSGASAGLGSNTSILFSTGNAQTPQWVKLLGQNTTNWLVMGYTTDVTFSAS